MSSRTRSVLAMSREALEHDIQEYAELYVRAGYLTRTEAVEALVETMIDDAGLSDEAVRAAAGAAVDQWFARVNDEATQWGITDNDCLALAAADLERFGILFRENYSCCQNCGFGEIEEEIAASRDNGSEYRGFAFFHEQDTESAVRGDGLHLAYGAVGEFADEPAYDEAAVAVGHEIVDALRRAGLRPRWNGRIEQRIEIRKIRWQRVPPTD